MSVLRRKNERRTRLNLKGGNNVIRPTKKQMEYINKIKQVIGEERLHNYLVRHDMPQYIDLISRRQAHQIITDFSA